MVYEAARMNSLFSLLATVNEFHIATSLALKMEWRVVRGQTETENEQICRLSGVRFAYASFCNEATPSCTCDCLICG